MAPWLFLDDLPNAMTSKQLESLCSAYGRVLWGRVVTDPYGRDSTYGYVEMATAFEAEQAARALNQTMISGQPIRAMLTSRVEQRVS